MFERKTQTEEREYQQGRRDGFRSEPIASDRPAYKAGHRAGALEALGVKPEE